MKKHIRFLVSVAAVLSLGAVALSAQSCAAVTPVSNAVGHSAAASGEVIAAGAESGAASVKVVSGVAAVPVFASGAVLASVGTVVASVGESVAVAGETTARGAGELWDFATDDPARRPVMDRTQAVPPSKATTAPRKPADPAPAQAMQAKAKL